LLTGNIDVYPRKGKRTGAFCAAIHVTQPVYVLLNFTGKLRDVTTIAHEMGHAINDELIKKHQNALNFDTPMSTAEVASTFMEDFITERLAEGATNETKLALMVSRLDDVIGSIFRQVAIYRFEQELHEMYRTEGYVTLEKINKLFKKHMESYMGPASDGCENWWVYWSHIRNFFYVYSYASGLLISKAMQAKVRQDKNFIKQVKIFLSAGISKSPKDIFSDMDIDITDKKFWEQGLDEIETLLNDTEVLAKKLGKI
jgi:oligoendopeptidase F